MSKSVSLKALSISNSALKDAELPSRIKVLDWGTSKTLDGEILFDEKSAEMFYDNQHAIGRTLAPLDFNHNTVAGTQAYNSDKEPRAVAGYGVPTVVENDGLYFEYMRWTPSGEKSARDFADLSPAVITDADNRVLAIHSCALTPAGAVENLSFYSADDVVGLMAKTIKPHSSDEKDKKDDEGKDDENDKEKGKDAKTKMKACCVYADVANNKYPIDTEEHVRAAWSYIHMARNQKGYSTDEISAIKHRIADKAKQYKIELRAESADSVHAAALPNAYAKAIQPYETKGIDDMLGEDLEYFRKALGMSDDAKPDDIMKQIRAKWEGMQADKEPLPLKKPDHSGEVSIDPQVRNAGVKLDMGRDQPHGTITYSAEAIKQLVTEQVGEQVKALSAELTTLKSERDNKMRELETEKRQMLVEQASRERKVIPLSVDEINAVPLATLESIVSKLKPEVNTEKQPLKAYSADGKKPELAGALQRASQSASDYFARAGVTWDGPAEFVPRSAKNLNPKNPVDTKSN